MDKDRNIDVSDKELSRIANFEAGTDGIVSDSLSHIANFEAGTDHTEAAEDSGVTDDAPYKNLAQYKMVPDTDEDDSLQNSQGS